MSGHKKVIGCQVRALRQSSHQFHSCHQSDFLDGQKGADLSQCVRTRIAIVNNDSSFFVRFSNFSKKIMVYHSELTLQRYSSGTVATWPVLPKTLATICFDVLFPQTAFVGFRSSSKVHNGGLLFCFGLICIDPWFVTCDDLINVFWSTAIVVFQHFYAQIDKSLFWAIAGFSEHKSFLPPGKYPVPKDSSISRYVTWRSCIISSRTASMFSGTTAVLGGPSRISSLSERRPRLN